MHFSYKSSPRLSAGLLTPRVGQVGGKYIFR
jgi:hypothetical protein